MTPKMHDHSTLFHVVPAIFLLRTYSWPESPIVWHKVANESAESRSSSKLPGCRLKKNARMCACVL